ncbi:alpha/beta hydrolase family protein [Enterococcus sp. DIV0756]|uniref:alpha/beta hydrolase family protein n=1 Tax=Enterococcus sp. DIV0756 TaxID=2774636 RepID=UPI003F21C1A3
MEYVVLLLITLVALGVIILVRNSTGKLSPLKDNSGEKIINSISEKVWIEVNGIKQGMFIRGENRKNPVLLYVHGGPGTPMLQFISYLEKLKNPERLEKYFTICYWDQRGSGMTYTKSVELSALKTETMVEDTHAVTEYLKTRFSQDKIYILGHSWGSYLSVKTIEKYPEDYHAYVGVGQISDQTESERLAYQYMIDRANRTNDEEVKEKLKKFDSNAKEFPWVQEEGHQLDYLMTRTDIFNKYGIGHLHDDLPKGLTFNSMVRRALFGFRGYTLIEKIKWFLGADFSMLQLFPVILHDNLFVSSVKFEVPFYIIQGAFDYQVSQKLAQKYFDRVNAPRKEFFLFDYPAHSPNLEEPEKFISIMKKIDNRERIMLNQQIKS